MRVFSRSGMETGRSRGGGAAIFCNGARINEILPSGIHECHPSPADNVLEFSDYWLP